MWNINFSALFWAGLIIGAIVGMAGWEFLCWLFSHVQFGWK